MVPRKIVDFRLDEKCDSVAELECGHERHVCHNLPKGTRAIHPRITTPQGRLEHLGQKLWNVRLAAVRCIRAGAAFVLAFLRETCVQQCGHGTNKCIG